MAITINPADHILVAKYESLTKAQRDFAEKLITDRRAEVDEALDYAKNLKIDGNGYVRSRKLDKMIRRHDCDSLRELYEYAEQFNDFDYEDQIKAYYLCCRKGNGFMESIDEIASGKDEIIYLGKFLLYYSQSEEDKEKGRDRELNLEGWAKLGETLVDYDIFSISECPEYLQQYLNYADIARDMRYDGMDWFENPDYDDGFNMSWSTRCSLAECELEVVYDMGY